MKISELHQLFLENQTICTDTRKIISGCLFFALRGSHFNANEFADKAIETGASYAIIDEAPFFKNHKTILVENVLETLQELALFHRKYLNLPIISLTGSNGKTTTKELINSVLSQQFNTVATQGNLNNHIGVPLTLLEMNKETEIGIVEMGANHPKEIEFLCQIAQPDFGYITNFGKAHLEGFGSIEGVIEAKTELYRYLNSTNKTLFINLDDPIQVEKSHKTNRYTFSQKDNSADIFVTELKNDGFNLCVAFEGVTMQSNLIGQYNISNIAAAITIGSYFNIPQEAIKKGIERYIPSNNRSQLLKKDSNSILLDAYNANPTSMEAALYNFSTLKSDRKILFLGDMFELGTSAETEHQHIANLVSKLDFNYVVLVGENFFRCKINSPLISKYNSFEALQKSFNFKEILNASVLIKGSRGMAMERIVELL